VSDGTGTQVGLQMINKCRIKMAQRGLYNVRDPHEMGIEKGREYGSNLSCLHIQL